MRRPLLLLALFPLTLLTACGRDAAQPKVAAFTDGICRAAAPDVLAIGRVGAQIGEAKMVDSDARTSLREAQSRLRDLAEAAEPAYKPSLDALVVSTGFVRIRADGNTYAPSVGRQLMNDYRAVVKICTAH